MGRCLFRHKWAIESETKRGVHGLPVRTVLPYRTCERCGAIERGIYDGSLKNIIWERSRERANITASWPRVFRQLGSVFDRLAHSFGLRRTRMSDRKRPGDALR